MFAVVETGGKQYKVEPGTILKVEKLEGKAGDAIDLGRVIMLGGDAGVKTADAAASAKVKAEIIEQFKADKVIVFKKKRRHNYRRKNGHRQLLTKVKVTSIG